MPPLRRRSPARGPVPWSALLTVAMQVVKEGRRRWDRLAVGEQRELSRLIRKSGGRLNQLTPTERQMLRRLVWKAVGPGR